MNNKDIYSDEFQNALVDIILNINKTNVKEVFDDSCRAVDQIIKGNFKSFSQRFFHKYK